MRTVLLAFGVFFFCCACKKSDNYTAEKAPPADTLYDGDFIWREKMKHKRLTIIVDNGRDKQAPVFKIHEEALVRIRIPRLTKYEIFPSEIHGAEIVKVDTALNIFLVTPTDSSFQFVLNQYYPKGRVVRYRKNWVEEKNDFEETVTPLNGFSAITHFEFRAHWDSTGKVLVHG